MNFRQFEPQIYTDFKKFAASQVQQGSTIVTRRAAAFAR